MDKQSLRILQVSTYENNSGAEWVAWNLFHAYRARGHSSWLAVSRKQSHDPDVLLIPNEELRNTWSRFWWRVHVSLLARDGQMHGAWQLSRPARWLAEPGRSFDGYRGWEDFHHPGTWRLLNLTQRQPDIVHCHNLHGDYFDLRALPWLSQHLPVLLTLHDAWLLSGHCAHSFECKRWKTGCGSCPDLSIYPALQRDATAYNWRRKQAIYMHSRLYVAAPSHWLMRKVEQSMLVPAIVEARVIPNGVDLSVFHPADKRSTRAVLGIPQDTKVILFAANGIRQNRWKDYQTMRSAVASVAERLQEQHILFIALGEDAPAECIGRAEIRFVPYVADPAAVARYYQASDVYVHAARAETFPTTVLEALACGTPVVATAVGGIPEQIDDSHTGFLVPPGDAQSLANRLLHLLSDDALRQRLGAQAVTAARERFDLRRQVDAYLDWYAELVAKHSYGGTEPKHMP